MKPVTLKSLRVAVAAAATLLPARAAFGGDAKVECGAAYERGQELRTDGKLKSAKETLAICARDVCPAFVKTECGQWLEEVTNDLPSIVLEATGPNGEPVTAVTVTIDGQVFGEVLDGKPIELDPGEHELHLETKDALPVDLREFLERGKRDGRVRVTFKARPPSDAAVPADEAPDAPGSGTSDTSWMRPASLVAAGVGAAGVVGFVAFGLSGKGKQADLESSCSPSCSQAEIDALRSRYLLADLSLGVGIVGLGAGTALFLLSRPSAEPAQRRDASSLAFDVQPSNRGAFATLTGRF